MPKRTDISSILLIGSGPIVIGQACEFDYSGTQACKALAEEGYRVILINSNPATIMTDPGFADRTYIEPITGDVLERIVAAERPDAVLPTMGGQTGLNAAIDLADNWLNLVRLELLVIAGNDAATVLVQLGALLDGEHPDLTVPIGIPSRSAIWVWVRSSKNANLTTVCGSGSSFANSSAISSRSARPASAAGCGSCRNRALPASARRLPRR